MVTVERRGERVWTVGGLWDRQEEAPGQNGRTDSGQEALGEGEDRVGEIPPPPLEMPKSLGTAEVPGGGGLQGRGSSSSLEASQRP